MSNFTIRLDLLKVPNTFVTNIKGTTATKRCLVIPLDTPGVFLGEKGCYLNLNAYELQQQKYEDSHCIKVQLPKEIREAMPEEERKAQPIIGGMHALQPTQAAQMPVTSTTEVEQVDDLPF